MDGRPAQSNDFKLFLKRKEVISDTFFVEHIPGYCIMTIVNRHYGLK